MSGAIYKALTGALFEEMRMEVLANDMANINTAGYKGSGAMRFSDQLSQMQLQAAQGVEADGFVERYQQFPVNSMAHTNYRNFEQGMHQHTGNKLNAALYGDGFFCVETATGIQYTRNGNFTLNNEGMLVTQEGLPVLGENGPIQLTGADVYIDDQGNITQDGFPTGRFLIINFIPEDLEPVGGQRFRPLDPDNVGVVMPDPEMRQGYLESSNVNVVRVMTDMIEVHRKYESYQKIIRTLDEVNQKAITDVGRLA